MSDDGDDDGDVGDDGDDVGDDVGDDGDESLEALRLPCISKRSHYIGRSGTGTCNGQLDDESNWNWKRASTWKGKRVKTTLESLQSCKISKVRETKFACARVLK